MTTKKFILNIKGEGFVLEQEIDSLQLSSILPIIFVSSEKTQKIQTEPEKNNDINLSPREYLNKNNAKSNPQKILVFASYLRNILKHKNVSIEDIKIQFEKASESLPKNFSRDFKDSLRSGWLSESHEEPGRYFITSSGDRVLESNFSESAQNSTSKKKRSEKGKFKKTEIRDEIKKLQLDPEDKKYINYFNLQTKGDKILWLLIQAKNKGIEDLRYKEIETLANKIGDSIPARDISSLIEKTKREGKLINPITDNGRILKVLYKGIFQLTKQGEVPERPNGETS